MKTFFLPILYSMAAFLLLFIIFSIVFSGSWHALGADPQDSLALEFPVVGAAALFIMGVLTIFLGGILRIHHAIGVIALSVIVLLTSFYFYWGSKAVFFAVPLTVILAAMQILTLRKS